MHHEISGKITRPLASFKKMSSWGKEGRAVLIEQSYKKEIAQMIYIVLGGQSAAGASVVENIKIKTPVFLAPMAGVTDYPFRILCKEMGAGMVYSEFVSADGIIRENSKTLDLIKFEEEERPIGIQIFGSDPEVMSKACLLYTSPSPRDS